MHMVMADRGFNIADLVAEYRAEAIIYYQHLPEGKLSCPQKKSLNLEQ